MVFFARIKNKKTMEKKSKQMSEIESLHQKFPNITRLDHHWMTNNIDEEVYKNIVKYGYSFRLHPTENDKISRLLNGNVMFDDSYRRCISEAITKMEELLEMQKKWGSENIIVVYRPIPEINFEIIKKLMINFNFELDFNCNRYSGISKLLQNLLNDSKVYENKIVNVSCDLIRSSEKSEKYDYRDLANKIYQKKGMFLNFIEVLLDCRDIGRKYTCIKRSLKLEH